MQAFVGGEAGLEGAEVPGERTPKGVAFDSRRFWAELGHALGMPAGASDAHLGDTPSDDNGEEKEGGGSSSDEGSSFFGGGEGDSEDEGDEGPDADGEALYRAQRAQRAKASLQQQPPGGPSGAAAAVSKLAQEVLAGKGSKWGSRDMKQAASKGAGTGAAGQADGGSRVNGVHAPDAATKAEAAGAGPGAAERGDQWEALTATDSDDEEAAAAGDDAEFAEAYNRTMARELARSRVGASFGASASGKSAMQGRVSAEGQHAGVGEEGTEAGGGTEGKPAELAGPDGEGEEDEEELVPVDVDLNLVESLLASYAGWDLQRLLLVTIRNIYLNTYYAMSWTI